MAAPVLDDFSDLVFRPTLLAAGVTDDELRRLRAQRRLTAVRPGAYVPSDDPRLADAVARHALAVRAAARRLADDTAVSHVSAAVLHGLTLWNVPLDRVHLTRGCRSGGRCTALRHLHTAPLDDDVTTVDAITVTSVTRTLADLARTLPFEQALVAADAALHGHRTTTRAALVEAVARSAGRHGSPPDRLLLRGVRHGRGVTPRRIGHGR